MGRAVLAHLERGQVEAERLHLPAEVLERPVGDAGQPVTVEHVPQLVQLREQLAGATGATGRYQARGGWGLCPARAGTGQEAGQ